MKYLSFDIECADGGKATICSFGYVLAELDATEKQGLINRTRSEEDERVVVVSLTEEGKALYKKATALD